MKPRSAPRDRQGVDGEHAQDTIERAAKRGAGGLEGVNYEEIRYEGYGPGGRRMMVDCLTDNRIRTVAEVATPWPSHGGNLGTDGSVASLIQALRPVSSSRPDERRKVLEGRRWRPAPRTLPATTDGSVEVVSSPADFVAVRNGLAKAG